MLKELNGRVAVVTGASAGIGRAIAEDIAASGACVIVNARRADRLEALARDLGADRAAAVAGDCADPAVIDAMLDACESRFDRPADLVVANAGRGLSGSVLTSDAAQWDEMVRTNLLGVASLARAAAGRMLKAGPNPSDDPAWTDRPRDIVVIGSNVGRHVSPFSSMYGSTKFAVAGLTEGLRRELAPRGIRATLIEPGFVVSEFQGVAGYDPEWFNSVVDRIGPVLSPADVARAVTFVASQPAAVHVNNIMLRPTRQDYP